MSAPLLPEVRAVLEKHEERLANIVLSSWGDWRTSPCAGVWRTKRGAAVFMWEQMIVRAHEEFDGVAGVHIIEGDETFKFLVDNRVLFRFKKADEAGLSANTPTQMALAFHDHETNLFGLPEVMRVEVVYQLNRLETAVDDILVVCRDGNRVAWTYSVLNRAAGDGQVPIDLPVVPTSPAERLVRPRDGSVPKEQNVRD